MNPTEGPTGGSDSTLGETEIERARAAMAAVVGSDTFSVSSLGDLDSVPLPEHIGSYRILSKLGEGGMGVVYEAEQHSPRRNIALKVIRPGRFSPDVLRRFKLEAELLGRLEHPGIGRIYESGTAVTTGGTVPFLAMELIRGRSLMDHARRYKLSVHQKLQLLIHIASAVHFAHQHDVIHRDIKPSNIIVTEDGTPKILDFGVARLTDSDVQATTMSSGVGALIGTLQYMSPEQARGDPKEVDERSDVYALGIVAYQYLVNKLPYDLSGLPLENALRTIREVEPPRLGQVEPSLRGDVETIVALALEKQTWRRYPSAAELADELSRHLANLPINGRPPSLSYKLSKWIGRSGSLRATALMLMVVASIVLTICVLSIVVLTLDAKQSWNIFGTYGPGGIDLPDALLMNVIGVVSSVVSIAAANRVMRHNSLPAAIIGAVIALINFTSAVLLLTGSLPYNAGGLLVEPFNKVFALIYTVLFLGTFTAACYCVLAVALTKIFGEMPQSHRLRA